MPAIIAVSLTIGIWFSLSVNTTNKDAGAENSTLKGNVLSPARKIAVPELQQHDGSPFNGKSLKGHWSILFFGFTHCSEICPVTLNTLAQAKKIAEQQNLEFPKVFLISVDPERDDLDALGEFVKRFDKSFTGVTGTPQLIKALSLQMNVFYQRERSTTGNKDDYQVGHSAALFLLNPEGNLLAFLSAPHTAEKIFNSTREVIDAGL